MSGKDFLVGSIIGGLIGAATALFLAPKSGKELRHDLNEQANIVKEKTEHLRHTAIEKGTGFAEVAKEKSAHLTGVVSEQSAQLYKKVREYGDVGSKTEAVSPVEENIEKVVEETVDTAKPTDNTEEFQRRLADAQRALTEAENKL